MADDKPIDGIGAAIQAANQGGVPAEKPKSEGIGQEEFLTLLVNQLQHQDPLNPMEGEEFAVQLAQFSQLEQLTGINEKLDNLGGAGGGASSVASMAAFLGHEVVLQGGQASFVDGKGSNLVVDVPAGSQSIRVDLIDQDGVTVAQHAVADVEEGSQVIELDGVQIQDGNYGVRVVTVGADGQFVELDAKATATVEGFVLEPEPMLLIGGEQVPLSEVVEVRKGKV